MKRINELASPLDSAKALNTYVTKVRELHRDLYMELSFAAETLQQNLATITIPGENGKNRSRAYSRIQARRVSNCLRRAADSQKYAGGQAVKCWREFTKTFAPMHRDVMRPTPTRRRPKFDTGL